MPQAHQVIVFLAALNKKKRSMGALVQAAKEQKLAEVTGAMERELSERDAVLKETERLK